ncbi:30S ribosomal protein S7 [Candidatus Woesearchaeota archaeon]|nr:30S ribosomal protein S7 [Candidatus Woesearchaeota archaeon]
MDVKFFNRWDSEGVKVEDPGLIEYINLEPRLVPNTYGRNAKYRFWKSKYSIVERLVNKIMIPGHKSKKHKISSGHMSGKNIQAMKIVENALGIVEEKTKSNPISVLVKAVENGAPREEIVAIEYGGARYPKAVECSPQRRIDISLRYMTQGAYTKAFNGKKRIEETLASEIIAAAQSKPESNSVAKKNETERQADAAR